MCDLEGRIDRERLREIRTSAVEDIVCQVCRYNEDDEGYKGYRWDATHP